MSHSDHAFGRTSNMQLWKVQVSVDKAGIAPHLPGTTLEANVLIEAGGINCPVVQTLNLERKKVKVCVG